MTSPTPFQVLSLLLQLPWPELPVEEKQPKPRRQIYTPFVVIWLMMYQRLQQDRPLSAAVECLRQAVPLLDSTDGLCQRLVNGEISGQTGAYCQARQRLSTRACRHVHDYLYQHLEALLPPRAAPDQEQVFVVDGTTLQLAHTPALVHEFPPGGNQHGINHWPVLQVVAFHNARHGLALRPSYGPMYGDKAVGEQKLALDALERLPAQAIVLGDANFGIFHFAYQVHQSQRFPVLRLSPSRAQRLLAGKAKLGRHRVVWEPSAHERRVYPTLPPAASVQGWLHIVKHPQRAGERLYLFTTLLRKPRQVLALYGWRWRIETDLRHLKRTVQLHKLTSKTPAMVEKELLIGVATYNLVYAVMAVAAQRAGIEPRRLSFARTLTGLQALPPLQASDPPERFAQAVEILLTGIISARLPVRAKRRSAPRQVWGRGGTFPSRQSAQRKESQS